MIALSPTNSQMIQKEKNTDDSNIYNQYIYSHLYLEMYTYRHIHRDIHIYICISMY